MKKMWNTGIPLLLCLMTSLMGLVTSEDSDDSFRLWQVELECPFPEQHPVSELKPHLLNLEKLIGLRSAHKWIVVYGQAHLSPSCQLNDGEVYEIKHYGESSYSFTGNDEQPIICKADFLSLLEGSYGFVSCAQMAVVFVLVVLAGVGAGVAWKRRSQANVELQVRFQPDEVIA